MHPFINQELARQHQEALLHEATHERMSRHIYEQTKGTLAQPIVSQQRPLSEPDFVAIRRDLSSMLSEWCLTPETASSEAMIDTFMQRLRMRLGYNKQHRAS